MTMENKVIALNINGIEMEGKIIIWDNDGTHNNWR